jgi:hypothetical protein
MPSADVEVYRALGLALRSLGARWYVFKDLEDVAAHPDSPARIVR